MVHRDAMQSTLARRNQEGRQNCWTSMRLAQPFERRVALQNPDSPEADRSAHGSESARYVLAVYLRDGHSRVHWEDAAETVQPYIREVLDSPPEPAPADTT